MDIRLQKVREDDAEFLYRFMNDKNILDALDEIPTQFSDWVEAISAWGRDPDEEVHIVFDENAPIGWLGINGLLSEDKVAYIKMIGLFPQYQNKGIGTYALEQALEMLRSRGFATVALYTDQSNRRAQNCYMKCGFNITEKLVEKMANGALAERYKMELVL